MAQQVVRLNLSASAFPFLSEFSGRGIIVKQSDQNYLPTVTSKEDLDKDVGVPSVLYCHNVIATGQGYQAVGYDKRVIAPPYGAGGIINEIFPIIDTANSRKAYLAFTDLGNVHICVDPYYLWSLVTYDVSFAGKRVTHAHVNGVTYIYVDGVGAYKYNFATYALDSVILTALVAANIKGIAAVQGYLIAWSKDTVAWSSLVDPTDFTPSLSTGAGSGSVQEAKGDIVTCVSHGGGMVIYTNQNAVTAVYSGNTRYPFNFKELSGSGGVSSIDMIAAEANSSAHYVYSSSGLQSVSLISCSTVMPEVTDFLSGALFEDFDESTNTLTQTALTAPLLKRLAHVSDRYLIISYGIYEYTHALIFDTILKRWSKFRLTHIKVFEFQLMTDELVETPRASMAFLTTSGDIYIVNLEPTNAASSGVVIIGKIQLIRQRVCVLDSVEVENVIDEGDFYCSDLYALDGKNFSEKVGYLQTATRLFRKILFNVTAINHTLLFKGAINLVSLVVSLHVHGRR